MFFGKEITYDIRYLAERQALPSDGMNLSKLFTTIRPLRRVGHLPRGGRRAGLWSQNSQRGVLGCQSHPKVVQILTISCFLIRISQNYGENLLS